MALPDATAIETAIITRLAGDATLSGLMPDGVYFDLAPPNAERFVLVSLSEFVAEGVFSDADGTEQHRLLVKAVEQGGTSADNAAARIHDVLHRQPLTVAGYELMVMQRVARVRYKERDPAATTVTWQHCGGLYAVMVSL